jgi:uncharacterized protein
MENTLLVLCCRQLSRSYHQATGDTSFVDDNCTQNPSLLLSPGYFHTCTVGVEAISQIFRVIDEQCQATFDANFNLVTYYTWTGQRDEGIDSLSHIYLNSPLKNSSSSLAGPVNNHGIGEPKGYTGMFRVILLQDVHCTLLGPSLICAGWDTPSPH